MKHLTFLLAALVLFAGTAYADACENKLVGAGINPGQADAICSATVSAVKINSAITGTLTTSGAITATTGGVTATAGGVTATAGGVTATAGGVTITAGDLTITNGDLAVPAAANLNLTGESGANTACNTTCTLGCIAGFDTGTSVFVACDGATADTCLCAGS